MKENALIFGYKSLNELVISVFGLKHISSTIFFSIISVANSIITKYIYDDARAVYFLVFLIGLDAFTGVWKSIKNKTFSSSKLPRILVLMVLYILLLGVAWNAAKFSIFYHWLPSVVYGGMIGTLIVSVFENLMELGYIPKNLYNSIKKKTFNFFNFTSNPKKKIKKIKK